MICHNWYFKDISFVFEPYAWDTCHDISMMSYELENIAILNVNGVDYRCVLQSITRNDEINRLNNYRLVNKGTFYEYGFWYN